MAKTAPPTFNGPSPAEKRGECYFCGSVHWYSEKALARMKNPYRCKRCATQVRVGNLEDVNYDK